MKLHHAMTCQCGADCQPGTDVRMERGDPPWPGVPSRWRVVACPACSSDCDRGSVALPVSDVRPEKRGGTLQQQIEARRMKRAKGAR